METPPSPKPATLRTLLTLAGPIIISRASQTVVGLSDALMVAHLGASALASTATGGLNAFTVLILPMGITFIVSSFASQLFGKGDLVGARRYGWYGLLVALATLGLSLVTLPFIDPVLSLLPYTGEVRALMGGYMRVRLLSAGAAIGIEALANYYGGLGRTWPGMVANLIAMLFNVAGNWLLIDGHAGFPALGVTGAAWASTVATTLGFFGFFLFFWTEGNPALRAKLQLAEFGRMLRFGLPSGFNWLFEFAAFVFFANVVVAGLGTAALAGYVFWADRVLELDAFNPQIAGRLARVIDQWTKLAEPYRSAAREAISRVAAKPDLSTNVREIVEHALQAG